MGTEFGNVQVDRQAYALRLGRQVDHHRRLVVLTGWNEVEMGDVLL